MSRLYWEWRRRNLERILYLVAIVLTMMAIALASGCSGNIDVTNPNDRFMVAQDGFNAALSSYNYQLRTADAATKAKWKEDIWPHFVTANEALNAWDESRNDAVKERAYTNLQRSLFDILISTGIIEEQEEPL